MDPRVFLQDVIRCGLCETPVPNKHCVFCSIHLCEVCEGKHLPRRRKKHYIIPFKMRGTLPNCQKHSTKLCINVCKVCDIPICALCISSGNHNSHEKEDILKMLDIILNDLEDLEKGIYEKHCVARSKIQGQRDDVKTHSQKMKTELIKQGEAFHEEIDSIVQEMLSEFKEMDKEHLAAIDKQEKAIEETITEITQVIQDLKRLLDVSDAILVSKYKSRNNQFKSLPSQFQVTLPKFKPNEIKREQIYRQFGTLSKLRILYPLIKEPRIVGDISTEYQTLRGVSCLSDNELWTHGDEETLRLYNLEGQLLKSVQTRSIPEDIAVTRSGDLVYTDPRDSSIKINKLGKTEIQSLITLQEWIPLSVCSTFSNDLLVIMKSAYGNPTKVVRYSGSNEKQSVQFDVQLKPLYSSGPNIKYIYVRENRNLDICVSDWNANAVVVVNAAGKFRFRYCGLHSPIKNFEPVGINTDSRGMILTADFFNHHIHIVDQNGDFVRYIDNYNLYSIWGLCVDTKDNLFIAGKNSGKVKKIQYYN